MVKIVALIERKAGMSHAEFTTYWREHHVPLVSQLPGLERYTTAVPTSPEDAPYDGIAEAYFDSEAAVEEAFRTDLGRRIRDDERNFVENVDHFVAAESVELE
jgi:uncharacterized protein (TIGR02118 family)